MNLIFAKQQNIFEKYIDLFSARKACLKKPWKPPPSNFYYLTRKTQQHEASTLSLYIYLLLDPNYNEKKRK